MASLESFTASVPPLAPQAADNGSVLLWGVSVFFFIGGVLFVKIMRDQERDRKECKERDALAQKLIADRDMENKALYQGMVVKMESTVIQNASAATKLADAINRQSNAIDKNTETLSGLQVTLASGRKH